MSTKRTTFIASTLVLALLAADQPAGARGFGGGGGFRGGGGGFSGGGYRGGGFSGGGFSGGGYRGGGGGFSGGGFSGGGYRGGGGGYSGGGFSGGGYRGGGGYGGYGAGAGGRTNFGGDNRFGVGNRTNVGIGDRNVNTGINRSFDGGNRTNFTNNNRTNIGVNTGNINRINNNSGNINRVNNVNINNSRWGNGSRWNNSYSGYHNGWVHGYWNGHNSNAWGWRGGYWGGGAWGFGAGLGLGWGLSSWGFGSSLYNWGYMPYANPYYLASPVVVQEPVYDYSQPIDTTSAAPEQSVTDQAVQLFDDARGFFMKGDYTQALALTDQALAKMPNDSALHEFRGLVLFALARYDQAAASLYAVLSVGPGWDWTTLISLYPNVDVYTAQLRALEAFCSRELNSAPSRFVLAYQYLTAGHNDAAIAILRQVIQLKPDDKLSAQLLAQLAPSKSNTDTTQPVSQPEAVDTALPAGATIEGSWKANPSADIAINLTIRPGGTFNWSVDQKGQKREFGGTSTFGDGILTLAQEQGPAMVGRVSWTDPSHITFHVVGDGPETPGLTFSK
ncbi:Tetratricopeptide repeat-containing protein [Singulisphaera sp. GP187]|uniref:tetratricopeptide repeat protein n=1 Tax=Singulisphaera sp. GP187 TaxID=1882752 RepID=UPI000926A0C7|nr:tetratricopeptide repeat protein [Singulisphaera sp. GP187]SIO45444.1 Tetratricopeptide repeat-containing protein [Singulisphaera sp. GP187]